MTGRSRWLWVPSACLVVIAFVAWAGLDETYGKDLDFVED